MSKATCAIPPPDQLSHEHPFAQEPNKPIAIWDGECGFCKLWIDYWHKLTKDSIQYAPYQHVSRHFPDIPAHDFTESLQFITPQGEVFSGAHAVFKILATHPKKKRWLQLYEKVPGVADVCETVYDFIADNRGIAYRLTRLVWGKEIPVASYLISRWVFLRLLGIVYLIAFCSFGTQAPGLIGSNGILPITQLLQAAREQLGPERYLYLPTLSWFSTSDAFTEALPIAGALLSLLLIVGIAQLPALIALWVLYTSLVTNGQAFMSFQWDTLLLEAGFLAIFFAPSNLFPHFRKQAPPSSIIRLLLWLLTFRLHFSSGIVKLAGNDPVWRDFTALSYHYQTQPIPNPLAWYAHQLPMWFQRTSTFLALVIEIAIPLLIFAPRRLRFIAAAALASLQTLIILTGNYAFFNLLALTLIVTLLDDTLLHKLLPNRFIKGIGQPIHNPSRLHIRSIAMSVVAVAVITICTAKVAALIWNLPQPVQRIITIAAQLHIFNSYGLFADMTTTRPEIIIQGSNDANTWQAYEFKYKPGDLTRHPPQVAPHQPRLDWQMWFAALRAERTLQVPQYDIWLIKLAQRLLEGSPEVLALFTHNPFPDTPPQYIRLVLYDYRFTDPITKQTSAAWWERKRIKTYLPAITLDNFAQQSP